MVELSLALGWSLDRVRALDDVELATYVAALEERR